MADMPSAEAGSDRPAFVRSEVWAAARDHYEAGQWDVAIFEALKAVETALQARLRSGSIGRALTEEAFEDLASGPASQAIQRET